jgi:hypothetical protein
MYCASTDSFACSAQKQWGLLSDIGDLIFPQAKNRIDFIQECKDGKLDGVVAAYRTKASASITGVFDEELCSVLPKSWKWLCHCGEFGGILSIYSLLSWSNSMFVVLDSKSTFLSGDDENLVIHHRCWLRLT